MMMSWKHDSCEASADDSMWTISRRSTIREYSFSEKVDFRRSDKILDCFGWNDEWHMVDFYGNRGLSSSQEGC